MVAVQASRDEAIELMYAGINVFILPRLWDPHRQLSQKLQTRIHALM